MYRKLSMALIFLLCSTLLWGCFGRSDTPTEAAGEVSNTVYVQLPEPYDTPVRQQLAAAGWQVTDDAKSCRFLVADAPQDSKLPQILLWDQPVDGAYAVSFDMTTLAASQISLLAQLPQNGDVNRDGIVSYAIISPTGSDYKQACQEAFAQLGIKSELLSEQGCLDDQAVAQPVAARILSAYGKDLDILLCGSQALSLGASGAAKDAGRKTDQDLLLLTVGQAADLSSATVYRDPQLLAETITQLVQSLSQGQTPPAITYLPLVGTVSE